MYTSKYTEVKTMNNLCVTVSIKLCKNRHKEIGMYLLGLVCTLGGVK